jgi:hypothetical protein
MQNLLLPPRAAVRHMPHAIVITLACNRDQRLGHMPCMLAYLHACVITSTQAAEAAETDDGSAPVDGAAVLVSVDLQLLSLFLRCVSSGTSFKSRACTSKKWVPQVERSGAGFGVGPGTLK